MAIAIAARCASISGLVTLDAVNREFWDTHRSFLLKAPPLVHTVLQANLVTSMAERVGEISRQKTLTALDNALFVQQWQSLYEASMVPLVTNRLAPLGAVRLLVGQAAASVTLDSIHMKLLHRHWTLPEEPLWDRELCSDMQGNASILRESIQCLSGQVTMQTLEQRIRVRNARVRWKNMLPPPSSRNRLAKARVMSRSIRSAVEAISCNLTAAAIAEEFAWAEQEYSLTENNLEESQHARLSTKPFFGP